MGQAVAIVCDLLPKYCQCNELLDLLICKHHGTAVYQAVLTICAIACITVVHIF